MMIRTLAMLLAAIAIMAPASPVRAAGDLEKKPKDQEATKAKPTSAKASAAKPSSAKVAASKPPKSAPAGPVDTPESAHLWRALRRGMTPAEVKQVLGEPRTISGFESGAVWSYTDPKAYKMCCTLSFDKAEHLETWEAPQ